jgi:glycosyltransferase involved in cell wall biosynthesis
LVEQINCSLGRTAVRWDRDQSVSDDALAAAYRATGAIVYVSESEAFGLPPFEALTYGTPAVLADTPLNRELYGSLAFYVPTPVTEDGLEAAMTASMHDREQRARIRDGAAAITERYTWARHAERFLSAVTELASR